jgi:hypothetical protein
LTCGWLSKPSHSTAIRYLVLNTACGLSTPDPEAIFLLLVLHPKITLRHKVRSIFELFSVYYRASYHSVPLLPFRTRFCPLLHFQIILSNKNGWKILEYYFVCNSTTLDYVLARVLVTIDEVWIGEWIYRPLVHTTRNYKHNATANLHILQMTRAQAKFSQSAFTSSFW